MQAPHSQQPLYDINSTASLVPNNSPTLTASCPLEPWTKVHIPAKMMHSRKKLGIITQTSASFCEVGNGCKGFRNGNVREQWLVRLADCPRRRQSAIDEICSKVLGGAQRSLPKGGVLRGSHVS